jgi:hypothetical protein
LFNEVHASHVAVATLQTRLQNTLQNRLHQALFGCSRQLFGCKPQLSMFCVNSVRIVSGRQS